MGVEQRPTLVQEVSQVGSTYPNSQSQNSQSQNSQQSAVLRSTLRMRILSALILVSAMSLLIGFGIIGFGVINSDQVTLTQMLDELVGSLVGGLVLSSIFTTLIAFWLADRLSEPVRKLAEAAQALAAGDSSVPLPTIDEEEGELGTLIKTFGTMRAQVDAREQALRRSEARNRAILNTFPDIIVQLDGQGTLLDYQINHDDENHHFFKFFVGQQISSFILKDLVRPILWHTQQALETGEIQIFECQTFLPIGKQMRDYEARFIASGENEVIIIIRDVTESNYAEQALRRSEQRLLQHIEYTPLAIIDWDQNSYVTAWNPAAETIFGYTKKEAIGQHAFFIVPEELHEYLNDIFSELLTLSGGRMSVNENRHKSGKTIICQWHNTTILDESGEVIGFTSIAEDVTESKRTEALLVEERALLAKRVEERTSALSAANAELSRAARLKDEFLAGMSHELRTPLNAILGLSEALQERVYGPLNERQSRSLNSIESSGRHLLSLINDILDLSKIEAGKLGLTLAPANLQQVGFSSLQFVQGDANRKQVDLRYDYHLPADEMVEVDQRRLKQILVNLLSNAVKFTPDQGRVGLEVTSDETEEIVQFIVWDTGIGIAEESMSRLFKPFVQLDSSLAKQYGGTGLGLALVYRMTEMHGGSVTVESEEGKGSRFTVSIPWRKPQPFKQKHSNLFMDEGVVVNYADLDSSDLDSSDLDSSDLDSGDSGSQDLQGTLSNKLKNEGDISYAAENNRCDDRVDEDHHNQSNHVKKVDHAKKIANKTSIQTSNRESAKHSTLKPINYHAEHRHNATTTSLNLDESNSSSTILLAEDNLQNVETISTYLKAKGYEVVIAWNGLQAIDMAEERKPDIILMDIQMPEMDGLEAIRVIRAKAERDVSNIPIVALTALAMPGDRNRCINAGANDYLSKPVSLKRLSETVLAHIE
ncbi:MAG: ATP-binding protein [Chloroflexota bacterium]